MGTPVWSHDGIICTGESYKNVVKLTFAKGASLKDPARLFNSSLEGNVRRAIDIHDGEEVDSSAFKALIRQAIALKQFWQVETFEESEVVRDAPPGQVDIGCRCRSGYPAVTCQPCNTFRRADRPCFISDRSAAHNQKSGRLLFEVQRNIC